MIFCAAVALIIVAAFLQTPRPKDRFMLCFARLFRFFCGSAYAPDSTRSSEQSRPAWET